MKFSGAPASSPPTEIYEFGDFRLDAAKRLVSRGNGMPLPLTPKVFDTLLCLVEHSGSVLAKERLMEVVWPDSVVEENNLNQNISTLRRVLGENPASHRYIVTVPGRGYRFVADVKSAPSRAHSSGAATIKSLAVLPFKPLVVENRDGSLEMGMADTLIARLSSIREVIVRPLAAVRRYTDLDQEPRIAGRKLRVESVLDGSIQKCGAAIRVTVRLINVSDGGCLWAGTFDEKFLDIFSVQDAIAERVVAALALRPTREERRQLTKRDTENTEAYQLYLKGRYFWWKTAPAEFRKGRDYFHRAVAADPSYALGYCGLNSYYGFGSAWGMLPPDEGWPVALQAIEKALELDDSLAEVHAAMGAHKMVYRRDWPGAEGEIRRAIELNPTFAEARYLYSFFLLAMGRFGEALAEARSALALDPFSVRITQHLGNTFYHARRYDEAIAQYDEALELDPDNVSVHESRANAFEQKGLPDQAMTEWQRALTLAGDEKLAAILGRTHGQAGFAAAVRAVTETKLERLRAKRKTGHYIPAIEFARAYVRMGKKEQAFRALSEACQERNVFALLLTSDPFYASIRDDPRFPAILRRNGLC
jgi:DNA-binding winged helix-turn-helix (wHTH) protein/tetratricopeptide (TPR) repeat protein